MVLIRIRRQRGQDSRGNTRLIGREEAFKAQVIQRLIRVIAQETLDVLGPPKLIIEVLGVVNLVVI